jgi:hypothetical protein
MTFAVAVKFPYYPLPFSVEAGLIVAADSLMVAGAKRFPGRRKIHNVGGRVVIAYASNDVRLTERSITEVKFRLAALRQRSYSAEQIASEISKAIRNALHGSDRSVPQQLPASLVTSDGVPLIFRF